MARVIHGDCLEVMRNLKAEGVTVQAIVTDPPYHLTTGNGSKGFMGKAWDGGNIAFDPKTWQLAYDLLPPGGHLVAFGGTRTFHRMACAIEDAGFEVRDQICWLFGSGFPKSHNLPGGFGTALKPAHEPIILARRPLNGTVAQNVQAHGVGAINVDGCRVGDGQDKKPHIKSFNAGARNEGWQRPWMDGRPLEIKIDGKGRWPANVVHSGDAEVEAAFAAFGESKDGIAVKRNKNSKKEEGGAIYGRFRQLPQKDQGFGSFGTASRFFYSAKASKADRYNSKHPTVKPVALMQWLVRMVTPKGGTVLDPFAGSGTTLQAAALEGFAAIGIEKEAEYVADIKNRMDQMRKDLFMEAGI